MKLIGLLITSALFLLIAMESGPTKTDAHGYRLTEPDIRYKLPDTLREISGLTLLDSATFASVQDENGILFIYDLFQNRIRQQYFFNIDGDYEGICKAGSLIYILRSDGVLFEIEDFESPNFKVNTYDTKIPATNNEGICYDATHNRLLISSKSNPGKEKETRSKRMVYEFDLNKKRINKNPVFEFDVEVIKSFANKNNPEIPQKEKGDHKEPIIKFRPSAICIHPVTNEIYMLSAIDHMLFIFNPSGELQHIELLNDHLFNKPEGISFFPNGDMLITNEGQDKYPTLLLFRFHAE